MNYRLPRAAGPLFFLSVALGLLFAGCGKAPDAPSLVPTQQATEATTPAAPGKEVPFPLPVIELAGSDDNALVCAFDEHYRLVTQRFAIVDKELLAASGELNDLGRELHVLLEGILQ